MILRVFCKRFIYSCCKVMYLVHSNAPADSARLFCWKIVYLAHV